MSVYCVSAVWPYDGNGAHTQDLFFRKEESSEGTTYRLCGVRDPDHAYILTDERQSKDNFGRLVGEKDIEELVDGETFAIEHIGLGMRTIGRFEQVKYEFESGPGEN